MPKPRAIVVVSAHWENAPLAISSPAAGTPLHYDSGGFHPRYHTLPYATPDATGPARRVAGALGATTALHQQSLRVLDHGAFIPLMAMYPAADVAGHTAAFDEWATDAVGRSDVDALVDYRHKGPGVDVAHATPEHFVPLLLTMGASTTTGRSATSGATGTWFGNSIRSLQVA